MNGPRVGVGVIGAGVVFRSHAAALAHLQDRAVLSAVADCDPNKLAAARGDVFVPHAYEDYRRLLDSKDISLIVVGTPPSSHEKIVSDGLEAGKYVICEKPVTHELAAADRIVKQARKYPGRLSVVYQKRFSPETQRAIWLRDQGFLGSLVLGRFTWHSAIEGNPSVASGWWGRWSVAGGGVVMTQFIHALDLMCLLFGRPVEVSATIGRHCAPIESEDVFSATVLFQGGAIVSCCGTACARTNQFGWDVIGADGSVHCPWSCALGDSGHKSEALSEALSLFPDLPPPPQLSRSFLERAVRKGLRAARLLPPEMWLPEPTEHLGYWKRILEAVESKAPLPVDADEARTSLDLCLGLYTSAWEGKPVSLPLARSSPFYEGVLPDAFDFQSVLQTNSEGPSEV